MKEQQTEDKKVSLDTDQLLSEIEQLKTENSCLKHTVAEQALDITTLRQWNDFIKKSSGKKNGIYKRVP